MEQSPPGPPLPSPAGEGILRQLRRRLGRRGVSSVVFAVSATALLGMGALATEGGVWYLSLRAARNAADAAAMAGAATHARYGETSGRTAASSIAGTNGYTHSVAGASVTVNMPPTSGTMSGTTGAYEVIITQTQSTTITRIIRSNVTPTVRVRAVAGPQIYGPACVLALGGTGSTGLDIGGSSNTNSPACVFASNLTGGQSIDRYGAGTVNIRSFHAVGGCYGCDDAQRVTLAEPARTYAPPTPDPLSHVQNYTQPSRNQLSCSTGGNFFGSNNGNNNSTTTITLAPYGGTGPNAKPTAFCSQNDTQRETWNLSNGESLVFTPGTYYFYNSTLQLNGGTVSCPTCTTANGVTLVFTGATGDNIGTMTLNGGVSFNLSAGTTRANPMNAAQSYAGVLIYRDVRASCNGGGTGAGCGGNFYTTNINGGSTSNLRGAIYMPSTDLTYNGGAVLTNDSCTVLIGRSISFSGNTATTGCSAIGASPTITYAIRLVE